MTRALLRGVGDANAAVAACEQAIVIEQLEGVMTAAGAFESGADGLADAADRQPIDLD